MEATIQHNISLVILRLGSQDYKTAVEARETLVGLNQLAVPQLEAVKAKTLNARIRYHATIALREIAKK